MAYHQTLDWTNSWYKFDIRLVFTKITIPINFMILITRFFLSIYIKRCEFNGTSDLSRTLVYIAWSFYSSSIETDLRKSENLNAAFCYGVHQKFYRKFHHYIFTLRRRYLHMYLVSVKIKSSVTISKTSSFLLKFTSRKYTCIHAYNIILFFIFYFYIIKQLLLDCLFRFFVRGRELLNFR